MKQQRKKHMQAITIIDTSIRQDAEGRYSLNDLHRAAMAAAGRDGNPNDDNQRPALFLRTDGVQEFVSELDAQICASSVATVRGRGKAQGTYGSELVVYRYAAWISAAFEVKVYSVFRDWSRGAVDRQMQARIAEQERNAARLECPGMTRALKETRAAQGKETPAHCYSTEMDMINRIVLGMSAKQYREAHGIDATTPLRDAIIGQPAHIAAIRDLQRTNQALIECGMEYQERKEKLQALAMRKHNEALTVEIMRLEA